ncbi:class I SAM-dependent methyltransferase [Streptomyces sp. NPDC058398]|uniref:class I SAM-dependent methyltransferase n=1 Tax=Streptomyces sp. NPDC058398 TaxID=3346479 RepID=UPI003652178B
MTSSPETALDAASANEGWEQAYASQPPTSLWQDEPIPLAAEALEFLREHGADTMIDLGCGDGRNLPPFIRAGLHVTGVDASPTPVERAAARLRQNGLQGITVTADAVALPFPREAVDAVTCFDAFSHFVDPVAALAEIQRVLRPGGQFMVNVFNTDDSECGMGEQLFGTTYRYRGTIFRFYQEDELRELLTGWKTVEFRTHTWDDPPHGEFRPHPHTHSNFVVKAVKA